MAPARGQGLSLMVATLALGATSCASVVTLALPTLDEVERRPPAQSFVYDAAGNQLAVLRQEFREPVPFQEIPGHLRDAVVAAEDRRFWTHAGIDARAIVRAGLTNLAVGEIEQGGSTITQQLVENLYLPGEDVTFETKLREAMLAMDLERRLSKEEILEEYLNTIYLGNGAYGVEAAAFTYWRKRVTELDLAESALLAGLVRAPETLNPTRVPDAARQRRDRVLQHMVDEGMVDADDAATAAASEVDVHERPPIPETSERRWVDFVVRTLLEDPDFGRDENARANRLYGAGLRIHTTLDPHLQAAAVETVARFFPAADDPEVAIATVEPETGAILALVGGRDYDRNQFDLATQGRRQPGSTFKTFVLAAAIGSGWRPDSPVNGNEGTVGFPDGREYPVRNYDRSSRGTITLEEATRSSVNAAYVRLARDIGLERVIAAARALGITSPLDPNPATAIGGLRIGVSPLEMAAAYGTLSQLGRRVPPTPISRIEDEDGNVVWRPPTTASLVIDPSVAWVVTEMLVDVVENGTGARARLPRREVAGKTGTTQDHADAWFVGYTTSLSTAVWMGYPEGRIPMRGVAGGSVVTGGSWPARIWREYMGVAVRNTPARGFVLPAEASVAVEIDPESGLLAAPWCPGETVVLPRVLVPTATCPSPPPTPTTSPSPTPTGSPSPTPTGSPASPSGSPTPTASPAPTASPSPTGEEPSPTPSPTAS
ncbi:MAG: transglycosylase domain-containing protein [Nitriliruptorales bacterium]